jgi:hypothetical protein
MGHFSTESGGGGIMAHENATATQGKSVAPIGHQFGRIVTNCLIKIANQP